MWLGLLHHARRPGWNSGVLVMLCTIRVKYDGMHAQQCCAVRVGMAEVHVV
jgi:hypothetical protein